MIEVTPDVKRKIARKLYWYTDEFFRGQTECDSCGSFFEMIDGKFICPLCLGSEDADRTCYDSDDFISQKELEEFVEQRLVSLEDLKHLEYRSEIFRVTSSKLPSVYRA